VPEDFLIIELTAGEPVDWSSPGATKNPREWVDILKDEGREIRAFLLCAEQTAWEQRRSMKAPQGDPGARLLYDLYSSEPWRRFAEAAGVQEEAIDTTNLSEDEVTKVVWDQLSSTQPSGAEKATPMITKVRFRNFKALRMVDVDLNQLTLLVGPNASGKTSILAGLYYFSQLRDTQPQELFKASLHPFLLDSRGGEGNLELEVSTASGSRRLIATPPHLGTSPEDIADPKFLATAPLWNIDLQSSAGTTDSVTWAHLYPGDARQQIGSAVLLQLEPERLAAPSYSRDRKPRLRRNGEGLPSVLAHMAINQPDTFQELEHKLRSIVPSVKRVRGSRAPVILPEREDTTWGATQFNQYWGDVIVFDFENAPNVPAHMASDGTLLALAILSAVMASDRPNLVLLDNLENGLHPKAQRKLVELLDLLLLVNPQMQIVATTHSPYLLDAVSPEQVRVTTVQKDGSVACRRLTQHPEFDKWKEEMTPGEFWSLIGEKWVSSQKAVVSQ
jgi:energy-coupling factor transporter ATP-binding protein EcfA2